MAEDKKYVLSFADFGSNNKLKNQIGEDYEMDLDADDFAEEHAKWIIGKAMDDSKKEPFKVDLQKAFDALVAEYALDDPEDTRPDMVKEALVQFLDKLSGEAKNIKLKAAGGNKPPIV